MVKDIEGRNTVTEGQSPRQRGSRKRRESIQTRLGEQTAPGEEAEALDLWRTPPRGRASVAGPLMSLLVLKGQWLSLEVLTEVALLSGCPGGSPVPMSCA